MGEAMGKKEKAPGTAGITGALSEGIATVARYSVALPMYPLRWLPESLRDGVSRPLRGLIDFATMVPRAVLDGWTAAAREATGGKAGGEEEPELTRPGLLTYRDEDQDAAIVFIHGFYMNMENTWGEFPRLAAEDERLAEWDVFSLGYATNFWIDIAGLWKASPPLDRLALLLQTAADNEPLDRYKTLALVAHSMGGLVVQRALVDSDELRARVGHLTLYGTPSNGLAKASLLSFWKRQIRDMAAGGPFVLDLRRRWSQEIGTSPPFSFLTVAGDQDELVPSTSSLEPFPERDRAIIPGDHLSIVNARDPSHLAVGVLVKHLTHAAAPAGPWNSARVAIEQRDFQRAIRELEPHRDELDDETRVSLALALASVDRQEDAIALLRDSERPTTDQMGTLAGRLKRRWLTERRRGDAEEAMRLYRQALAEAEKSKDAAQGFYHAINVAFMELAYRKDQAAARDHARRALEHCAKAPEDLWRFATEGEASLVLGRDDEALAGYRKALAENPQPWQIASMYEQASRVADLLSKPSLADRLRKLFREPEVIREAEESPRD